MTRSTDNFYAELPAFDNFLQVISTTNFIPIPEDWYLLMTDIIGSTKAIEAGRYKDVNMIGACSIAAVLNIAGSLEIPFVFGGDGATLFVPASLLAAAQNALLATQAIARKEFALQLRLGAIPIRAIAQAGYAIKLAKLQISENYSQVMITGGGLAYAESLIKQKWPHPNYEIQPTASIPEADLTGLECRWQDIISKYGETLSLLVLATTRTPEQDHLIYRRVMTRIQNIYGEDVHWCPVTIDRLNLAFDQNLMVETKARSPKKNWISKQLYFGKIWLENLLGFILMKLRIKSQVMDWGCYKALVSATTDYKKFDEMLRLIISGNTQQRQQLVSYLEQQYQRQKLVYGLHISDRALMTCLVFERNGRQVHFLDGANGGYALAAKSLKARMEARKT